MPSVYVPLDHHLMRQVPWGRLRKDADDNVIGIEAAAFRLRPAAGRRETEEFLSAGWVEYFDGDRPEQLSGCVRAFRHSSLACSPKSGFAVGKVQRIAEACLARERKVRIIHEPTDDNACHVALRGWPADDDLLFEEMARSSWNELVLNKDVA